MVHKLEVLVEYQEDGMNKVFRHSFSLPEPIDIPYFKWQDKEQAPQNGIIVWQHTTLTDAEREELIRQGKMGTAKL